MTDWRLIALAALAGCAKPVTDPAAPASEEQIDLNLPMQPETPRVPQRQSVFTKLDPAKCRLLEENKEEGPYWLRRCLGAAGWQLDWSESDLRQGLTLIDANGRETELRLSDLVANGAFNSIGETIEWRGRDVAEPEALIVRMSVANGVEPRKPDISRLAVVRLTRTPCLVAVVEPGPSQNERARAIADGTMPACLTD